MSGELGVSLEEEQLGLLEEVELVGPDQGCYNPHSLDHHVCHFPVWQCRNLYLWALLRVMASH